MAFITKGISLYHNNVKGNVAGQMKLDGQTAIEGLGLNIPGLQEVGELTSGSANAGFDKIEVTTLADSKHEYVNGLQADAESGSAISFTLLYDPKVYNALLTVIETEKTMNIASPAHEGSEYNVTIPNVVGEEDSVFCIHGTSAIKLNAASVNAALTMTLTVTPVDEITFTA